MFFVWLSNFFKGYVLVKATGRQVERLFNLCTQNGVLLWDIKRAGENAFYFKVTKKGFYSMRKFIKNTDCRVHIVSKKGFFRLLKKYKGRKWFLVGGLIFALAIFTAKQFIWKIEIIGNENVKKSDILYNLEQAGVKKGAFKKRLDAKEIKNSMLINMPELSWLWADLKGSKVIVNVKEKAPQPEIFDESSYKSVIADKDGIICEMVVKSGEALVSVGDTVLKGDVLVSGELVSKKELPTRFVQADAEVYARVWREKTENFSINYVRRLETGKVEKKHRLNIGGLSVSLYKDEYPDFENYLVTKTKKEFKPFGAQTGISIETNEYRQFTESLEKQSAESVVSDATLFLLNEIEKEVPPNSKRESIEHSFYMVDSETVSVTVTTTYIENIAKKVDGNEIKKEDIAP